MLNLYTMGNAEMTDLLNDIWLDTVGLLFPLLNVLFYFCSVLFMFIQDYNT